MNEFDSFIRGFIAGEGSFCISKLKLNNNVIRFVPEFAIGLLLDDEEILLRLKEYMGIGKIIYGKSRPVVFYKVAGLKECISIMNYLEDTEWYGTQKGVSFKKWCIALMLMKHKYHLTNEDEFIVLIHDINKKKYNCR